MGGIFLQNWLKSRFSSEFKADCRGNNLPILTLKVTEITLKKVYYILKEFCTKTNQISPSLKASYGLR